MVLFLWGTGLLSITFAIPVALISEVGMHWKGAMSGERVLVVSIITTSKHRFVEEEWR